MAMAVCSAMSPGTNPLIAVTVPGTNPRGGTRLRTTAIGAQTRNTGMIRRYQPSSRGVKVGSQTAAPATRKAKIP
jgi:hypothetical protein